MEALCGETDRNGCNQCETKADKEKKESNRIIYSDNDEEDHPGKAEQLRYGSLLRSARYRSVPSV